MGRQQVALLREAFAGRTVLVTGHTGFKGGWLSLWLKRLGATVVGMALPPDENSVFDALALGDIVDHRIADIRDEQAIARALEGVKADYLFHLAAQPLVRRSYAAPVETYATNVMGTVHVLEAVRRMGSFRAAVIVTSDKCYDNREWVWGYREGDPMGGADPYSSSKGAAELVAAAYRRSFLEGKAALATARAGNVIGGGDWAEDRLVPDIVRAGIAGLPVSIRHPRAVRPWQHVLEPLFGYLLLGARLATEGSRWASAWNFGPPAEGAVDVESLARAIAAAWGPGAPILRFDPVDRQPHEAHTLRLDISRARFELGWSPVLALEESVRLTVAWYKTYSVVQGTRLGSMRGLTENQIADYETRLVTIE